MNNLNTASTCSDNNNNNNNYNNHDHYGIISIIANGRGSRRSSCMIAFQFSHEPLPERMHILQSQFLIQ